MSKVPAKYIIKLNNKQRKELIRWYKSNIHDHNCSLSSLAIREENKQISCTCDCGHSVDLTEY